MGVAPDWGMRRLRARASAQVMARHYDAASVGRRTSGWQRYASDANTASAAALTSLRELSRDLRRNNGWAKRGIQVIANNSVGWGIMPKPKAGRSRARNAAAIELWNDWADSTACDFDGRLNFYGLQRLAMETIVESGEVLIVRQAPADDKQSIPMRLQVLEPDYLDSSKHGLSTPEGGTIIGGVEFDARGRRVAYWMFTSHPGSQGLMSRGFESVRVPADRVLHVYHVDRPGQVRGVPWLAAAIARLNDLDDFEDAELMQQKVAACFGAFVTDMDGQSTSLGAQDEDDDELEHLEPGHIAYLPPGKTVTFAQPPRAQDGAFTIRSLRRIAVSIGVPYEDLTADFSQVNYSSARMARLAHWQNVSVWREHMLIPQLCGGVWAWAMELAAAMQGWPTMPLAHWSAPPMPILEPDKEGLAYLRLVRIGAMTWPQMVRELGYDPTEQLTEIAETNAELDKLGIVLDIDPRKTNGSGQGYGDGGASSSSSDTTADDDAVEIDVDED
jgi:lambda family phage portal protein